MIIFSAPVAFARSNPATKASQSASLLVIGKSSQIMHSILSPSGVCITTPASPARWFDNPSVWMLHILCSSAPLSSNCVYLAMKSATTWPFTTVSGWYCTSNLLSSIAYKAILPAASRLLMALFKGWSVRTMMVWAWKYGLSFRAVVTSAKANFSILGYLSSAPRNALLIK